MGKEEILSYLKNAKIQEETLKKICYCFVEDYTAIQTANKLSLSRQTINNYYKILRTLLICKQEELIDSIQRSSVCNNSFSIKYLKITKNIYFLLQCNEKIFILNEDSQFLPKLEKFIEIEIKELLLNKSKNNCAQVLFNQKEEKYLITKLYKTVNPMQDFMDQRLKKFRGLNKKNIEIHLKESQFRYNYSSTYLYETLISLLNLNTKMSA